MKLEALHFYRKNFDGLGGVEELYLSSLWSYNLKNNFMQYSYLIPTHPLLK